MPTNRPEPPSSRDLPSSDKVHTEQDRDKALVKDADKTDVADRDRVHGDGKDIGLD